MKAVKMKVSLIGCTYACGKQLQGLKPETIVISSAAKQCYNTSFDYQTYFDSYCEHSHNSYEKYIQRIAASGHTSILEHASVSFLITGVSRALSHQLVRHRIASYTQQSQRYVNVTENDGLQYITPPSIEDNPAALSLFNTEIQAIQEKYDKIVKELIQKGYSEQRAREDARFILPNATATNLVMTMNYRELGDFLGKRMCSRAQWEIRKLACEIYNLMREQSPYIFGPDGIYRGPKCRTLGYCNERVSCGITQTLQDIKNGILVTGLKCDKFSEEKKDSLYKKAFYSLKKLVLKLNFISKENRRK